MKSEPLTKEKLHDNICVFLIGDVRSAYHWAVNKYSTNPLLQNKRWVLAILKKAFEAVSE